MSERALIVVDVQPTFCEEGELGVLGGNDVARKIAEYVTNRRSDYAVVATTQDWHIEPGDHFSDTPDFLDSWPPHGVAGSPNAELHPALHALIADIAIKKGQYEAAYSGFEGTDENGRTLQALLREAGVGSVDIVGLAEDHCVRQTALDAVAAGFEVCLLTDLTAPVDPERGRKTERELADAGVALV